MNNEQHFVNKREPVFWHSLTPVGQHDKPKTSLSAAVDSSSFQTSHAIREEGSATRASHGCCSVSWSVAEWGWRCGRLLISLWTSVASIRRVVRHQRGEVRAEWSGFMCVRVMMWADNNSETNRFTKSSPCFSTSMTTCFCFSLSYFSLFLYLPVCWTLNVSMRELKRLLALKVLSRVLWKRQQ